MVFPLVVVWCVLVTPVIGPWVWHNALLLLDHGARQA